MNIDPFTGIRLSGNPSWVLAAVAVLAASFGIMPTSQGLMALGTTIIAVVALRFVARWEGGCDE